MMKIKHRASNNPKRRILSVAEVSKHDIMMLAANLTYVGSAYHKRYPADYNFQPPTAPRPHKSFCDNGGAIFKADALGLVKSGVRKGMISAVGADGLPKHIWSVLDNKRPFEANLGSDGYHGYELEGSDPMSAVVLTEWRQRSHGADN